MGGGGGGGVCCQTFFLFSFPCSADHERDWPPCNKVVFSGWQPIRWMWETTTTTTRWCVQIFSLKTYSTTVAHVQRQRQSVLIVRNVAAVSGLLKPKHSHRNDSYNSPVRKYTWFCCSRDSLPYVVSLLQMSTSRTGNDTRLIHIILCWKCWPYMHTWYMKEGKSYLYREHSTVYISLFSRPRGAGLATV